MYSKKPPCQNSSGHNSQCSIQYESISSFKLDLPPLPEGVDSFKGVGSFDTGHAICTTCNAKWAYTLINGEPTYIPRVSPEQEQKSSDHSECESCKP